MITCSHSIRFSKEIGEHLNAKFIAYALIQFFRQTVDHLKVISVTHVATWFFE